MQYLESRNKKQTRRKLTWLFLALLCIFTGCADSVQSEEGQYNESRQENMTESVFSITAADLSTDASDAVFIDLSDFESEYVIKEAGNYVLSGSLNGSIRIDAEEQIIHLFFADVSVKSAYGPAISAVSAGKVIITLLPESVNTLSDSGYYQSDSEENACIYSNCDLTINGSGILSINGYFKDGIHSKDVVKLLGGELVILAKRNGIRGNDGILLDMKQLTVESEGSGLQSTKDGKDGKGTIELAGGNISIVAGEYAVSSIDDLYIHDCSLYMNAVISDFNVTGDSYIQEGCTENE